MNQKNDNFIDKTFTVLADVLIKVLPATKDEKKAFSYYRYGMSAQSNGDYAEALENYYEALKLEEDPYDRSYILYNIGLIYGNNGDYSKALEYYHQALDLNSKMPQALNNIAVIYHYQGTNDTTGLLVAWYNGVGSAANENGVSGPFYLYSPSCLFFRIYNSIDLYW